MVASTVVSEAEKGTRTADGESYTVYKFPVTSVAKDADFEFVFKICDTENNTYLDFADSKGVTVSGDEGLAYSIVDYLDDRIANSKDDNMKKLAEDLKAYHVYAMYYFAVRDKGSTEPLPTVDGFQTVTAGDLADYAYTAPGNIEHFTYKGTMLDLLADTSFRLYFASDSPGALTVTCGGSQLTPVENGSMWYVEVKGIAAQDLDDMYDITVSNADGATATAHRGPLGYARWALSTTAADAQREALQHAMMALYHYNQAAETYFKNTSNQGD